MTTMVAIIGRPALVKAIGSIKGRTAKLDNDIHAAAVQCLLHAQEHGDVSLFVSLTKALGKGGRPIALQQWAEAFSPIRINGDGQGGLLKKASKNYVPFDIEKADETPYYDFTSEKQSKPLSLEALLAIIAGMEKKIDKAEEAGKIEGNVVQMRDYARRLRTVVVPEVVAQGPIEAAAPVDDKAEKARA